MFEKILAGLMLWILTCLAVALTIGLVHHLNKPSGLKVDCVTMTWNPDAVKEQRELCRAMK